MGQTNYYLGEEKKHDIDLRIIIKAFFVCRALLFSYSVVVISSVDIGIRDEFRSGGGGGGAEVSCPNMFSHCLDARKSSGFARIVADFARKWLLEKL